MNALLVFGCILIAGVVAPMPELPKELTAALESCAKENNIEVPPMEKMMKPDEALQNNHDFKCFELCTAVKMEICSAEGKPNLDKIKAAFEMADDDMKVVEECAAKATEKDPCENAFLVKKCIMENFKE